jgi:epoxyqueuosine reductase
MASIPVHDTKMVSTEILVKAREYGADLAGFASVRELAQSPSMVFSEQLAVGDDPALENFNAEGQPVGPVSWPEGAKTVLVIGVHHPVQRPELDWWFGSADPPGNRILSKIISNLCSWITERYQTGVFHLPYRIERGGIYLKDAAVLSGLGCIGKNNMLVTPDYGPRIRLRALTLAVDLPSTGRREFDPCADCEQWCQKDCPQQALVDKTSYTITSPRDLPGRDGCYSRRLCNMQMKIDKKSAQEQTQKGFEAPVKLVKFCRRCELSCPVGRSLAKRPAD